MLLFAASMFIIGAILLFVIFAFLIKYSPIFAGIAALIGLLQFLGTFTDKPPLWKRNPDDPLP